MEPDPNLEPTFSSAVSTMPTPNITAKNISDKIAPLLDAAAITLLGTIDNSMSMPCGWVPELEMISRVRSAFSWIN
ncbi:hypothetical protein QTI90_23890 [Pectobacterium brasiliense]|nr:hypothetical protein [Pectobacterium brasiliense]WJM81179.1 hypothetical protein QTI90_23890 [Pectobacterium brasiliense]